MMAGDEENAIEAMRRFYECPADALLINLKERYYVLRAYIMMAAREIAPGQNGFEFEAIPSGRSPEDQAAALEMGIRQVCGCVIERQNGVQGDQCAIYIDYLKEHFSASYPSISCNDL